MPRRTEPGAHQEFKTVLIGVHSESEAYPSFVYMAVMKCHGLKHLGGEEGYLAHSSRLLSAMWRSQGYRYLKELVAPKIKSKGKNECTHTPLLVLSSISSLVQFRIPPH